jgi:hypothetical protein
MKLDKASMSQVYRRRAGQYEGHQRDIICIERLDGLLKSYCH